jgi:hypothetical protein
LLGSYSPHWNDRSFYAVAARAPIKPALLSNAPRSSSTPAGRAAPEIRAKKPRRKIVNKPIELLWQFSATIAMSF